MFANDRTKLSEQNGAITRLLIAICVVVAVIVFPAGRQSEAFAANLARSALLASIKQQPEQSKLLLTQGRRKMRRMRRRQQMRPAHRRENLKQQKRWRQKKKVKRGTKRKRFKRANSPSPKAKRIRKKKKSKTVKAPSSIAAGNSLSQQNTPPVPELAPVRKDPISTGGVANIGLASGEDAQGPAAENSDDNIDPISGPYVEQPDQDEPGGQGYEITGHHRNPNVSMSNEMDNGADPQGPDLTSQPRDTDLELRGGLTEGWPTHEAPGGHGYEVTGHQRNPNGPAIDDDRGHGNSDDQTENWEPDDNGTGREPYTEQPGRHLVCLGGSVWSGRCRCGPRRVRRTVRPGVFICGPAGDRTDIPGVASSVESSPPQNSEGLTNTPLDPTNRTAAPAITASLPSFAPDEVLVLVAPEAPEAVEEQIAQSYGLELLERWPLEFFNIRLVRFRIPDGRAVPAVVASLQAEAQINSPQPNYYYSPRAGAQGSSDYTSASELQYALAKLDIARARLIATGDGVRVAIIDAEIDNTHPDLAGSLTETFNAATGGRVISSDHGTAIAGIISARGMLHGVAPNARLLGVNALTPVGDGQSAATTATLMRGLDWAVRKNADIINLSLTGPEDALLKRGIALATEKGTIIVAAAGNKGPKAPPAYPAAYRQVIAVTATDVKDTLYTDANRGGFIDIAAPGVDVLTPSLDHGHLLQTGTSFAAAHITGIIALMLEHNPALDLDDIRQFLRNTAMDLGPAGYDEQFGAGNANAFAALTQMRESMRAKTDREELSRVLSSE